MINKIIYGGETLLDLTSDTIEESTALVGTTFHKKDGTVAEGACTFDSDTSEDNVAVAEILLGKTCHARGTQLVGTMPNIGKQANVTISTKTGTVTIAQGYHDGSAKVGISTTEQNKIIASNIKNGVTILGVNGTYTGENTEKPQSKTVTPNKDGFTVLPDTSSGYTCLSQVVVNAIPYATAANSAGGTTVTIG